MRAIAALSGVAFLSACIALTLAASEDARTVPDERDRRVLETLLLKLVADPEFAMLKSLTNGSAIVLNGRTPSTTSYLRSEQIHSDTGGRVLPVDAERDLRTRNTPVDAKPDTFDSVASYYTNLTFAPPIVVDDLKQQGSILTFHKAYPNARGWVAAHLPGYSKDGSSAVIRAAVGPSAHGATVTALLDKKGDEWVVRWHYIAWYL